MFGFRSFGTLALVLSCCGCQAVGELAYDSQAGAETARCNRIDVHQERQECLAKVKLAQKQAAEARRKP